ncbi:MAG: glutaredoxin family protein [Deltaproteobacteria bacterium]|nr:glutaredoxin family protein [Deltaproteobacteria bacterium]
MGKRIVIYTTSWCRDCRAAKKFLDERGLAYEEIDIEKTPEAGEIVMKLNDGMRKVPTLDIEGKIVSGDRFDPSRFEKDLREAGVL